MSTLERAVAIAAEAHAGQVDKAGKPYIPHPLRVMLSARSAEERIAAVLHDVVEDSRWTLEDLQAEGFSASVLQAVDALTRRPAESYEAFVNRVAQDPIGARVKLLDLADNAELTRIPDPGPDDFARIEKHRRAIKRIQSTIPGGP